jgi:lantibiotic biosynthesis protein
MENLYRGLDFFMMRNPILSFDEYISNFNDNNLTIEDIYKQFNENSLIREAILVSSISLYNSLKNKNGKEKDIIESYIKYFIRMTTRTTPFGLFSGVSVGNFASDTNIKFNRDNIIEKYARVDMEWLFKVIDKIKSNEIILKQLKVEFNNTIVEKGNRIDNIYSLSNKKPHKSISINNSLIIEFMKGLLTKPIKVIDLINEISKQAPQIHYHRVEKYIIELIKNDYLIAEITPRIIDSDPLRNTIKILKDTKEAEGFYNSLIEVDEKIQKYNNSTIGYGEEIYIDVINAMKKICESSQYLQVDMRYNYNNLNISDIVKSDIEDFVEKLVGLNKLIETSSSIKEYKMDFIEKYSENQEVPLMELIDENIGIGYPATYLNPISKKRSHKETDNNSNKLKHYIYNKITQKVNVDEFNISLDEIKAMKEIKEVSSSKDLVNSFEANFMLFSNSVEDLDKGKYKLLLGANYGSDKAGKMFGRFLHVLDDETYERFKETAKEEEKLINDENVMLCDISIIPSNRRSANVSLSKSLNKYQLCISQYTENKVIDLKDLVVGIDNNKFYVKSIKLNKRIILYSTNMLNISLCHNIYRLLIELTNEKNIFSPFFFIKDVLKDFSYVPEIKLGNVTVYPKTWKIDKELLNIDYDINFKDEILKWKKENNVSDNIYINEGDNVLLLDLKNDLHINIFKSLIKKSNKLITITEGTIGFNGNNFIKGKDNNSYFGEIVVPFIKNINISNLNKSIKIKDISNNYCSDEKRIFLPYSDWIYLKIYTDEKRDNEILSNKISKFIDEMYKNNYILKGFYIRYKDPNNHIRLRLLKNVIYEEKLNKEINNMINSLYKDKATNRIIIDTYFREIERYGGVEVIEIAETFFSLDTLASINTIKIIGKLNDNEKTLVYAINLVKLIEDCQLSFLEQLELLDSMVSHNENRDEFTELRRDLMSLLNSDSDWRNLRAKPYGEALISCLKIRSEGLKSYMEVIDKAIINNTAFSNKKIIIRSLMHMSCNRIMGVDRKREQEIYALVRHTLYALKYFKVNLKEKEINEPVNR